MDYDYNKNKFSDKIDNVEVLKYCLDCNIEEIPQIVSVFEAAKESAQQALKIRNKNGEYTQAQQKRKQQAKKASEKRKHNQQQAKPATGPAIAGQRTSEAQQQRTNAAGWQ